MGNLSSVQVKQLADNMLRMANAMGDYRYTQSDQLNEMENEKMKELYERLLSYTTELYTKSTLITLIDAENDLKTIELITDKTQRLYENLGLVQKIIDWSAKIVNMAAAIVSIDTDKISTSIGELVSCNITTNMII